MRVWIAEGDLAFCSADGHRLQLVARPDRVRLEAADLRSALRSWRSVRAGRRGTPEVFTQAARRLGAPFEVCVAGLPIASRRAGDRSWWRPRPLNLLRAALRGDAAHA